MVLAGPVSSCLNPQPCYGSFTCWQAACVVVKRQLSALTSCKASKPSAVHLKGSGATSLVMLFSSCLGSCQALPSSVSRPSSTSTSAGETKISKKMGRSTVPYFYSLFSHVNNFINKSSIWLSLASEIFVFVLSVLFSVEKL